LRLHTSVNPPLAWQHFATIDRPIECGVALFLFCRMVQVQGTRETRPLLHLRQRCGQSFVRRSFYLRVLGRKSNIFYVPYFSTLV
jgi:hypothetical protein